MRVMLLLLPLSLSLLACGNSAPGGKSDAEWLADEYMKDCRGTPALNPKAARELAELCSCATAKIRASGIKRADGDEAKDRMIQYAGEACVRQVYGSKG